MCLGLKVKFMCLSHVHSPLYDNTVGVFTNTVTEKGRATDAAGKCLHSE